VSTIDDYWAFVRMLLDKGTHEGERIISQGSVELMITDHLSSVQRAGAGVFLGEHGKWGLGFMVPAADVQAKTVPAGFGWDGGTGTTWRSDVDSGLTGILFTQRAMTSPEPPPVFVDFWDCAYGAMAD